MRKGRGRGQRSERGKGRGWDGTELGAGGEVWAWPGRINAERDVGWWGDWVGLRDVDPALSLAVAGSGAASGPGRPCSPSVPRDPGISGLSRPALCDPGQSKAVETYIGGCLTKTVAFDSAHVLGAWVRGRPSPQPSSTGRGRKSGYSLAVEGCLRRSPRRGIKSGRSSDDGEAAGVVRSRDSGGVVWVALVERIVRAAWGSSSGRGDCATHEGKRPNG